MYMLVIVGNTMATSHTRDEPLAGIILLDKTLMPAQRSTCLL